MPKGILFSFFSLSSITSISALPVIEPGNIDPKSNHFYSANPWPCHHGIQHTFYRFSHPLWQEQLHDPEPSSHTFPSLPAVTLDQMMGFRLLEQGRKYHPLPPAKPLKCPTQPFSHRPEQGTGCWQSHSSPEPRTSSGVPESGLPTTSYHAA